MKPGTKDASPANSRGETEAIELTESTDLKQITGGKRSIGSFQTKGNTPGKYMCW